MHLRCCYIWQSMPDEGRCSVWWMVAVLWLPAQRTRLPLQVIWWYHCNRYNMEFFDVLPDAVAAVHIMLDKADLLDEWFESCYYYETDRSIIAVVSPVVIDSGCWGHMLWSIKQSLMKILVEVQNCFRVKLLKTICSQPVYIGRIRWWGLGRIFWRAMTWDADGTTSPLTGRSRYIDLQLGKPGYWLVKSLTEGIDRQLVPLERSVCQPGRSVTGTRGSRCHGTLSRSTL